MAFLTGTLKSLQVRIQDGYQELLIKRFRDPLNWRSHAYRSCEVIHSLCFQAHSLKDPADLCLSAAGVSGVELVFITGWRRVSVPWLDGVVVR